ncbi:hypothetical protein DK26_15295 [Bosea sp. WAO]|nr:hypothetical protein DK26_15295 [Bosea sp. WAO]
MGFYVVCPECVRDHYIALCREHNDPKTPDYRRDAVRQQANGVMEAVRLIYGAVTAGMLITDADVAMGCLEHDKPMCAGFLINPPPSPEAPHV